MNLLMIFLAALHPRAVQRMPMCPLVPDFKSPPPVFYQRQYNFTVSRDNIIGQVRASAMWNPIVRYSLVGTDDFKVDVRTGSIRTMSSLNREAPKSSMFFAVATDQHYNSGTATIWANFEPACPGGVRPVQCFVNPCDTARCTAFPKAQCHANYCGGCYAEFYRNNERVNCTGKAPKPGVCPIAPPGLVTTCDVNCHHDSECPRNEKCCNWACTVGCRTPDPACPGGVRPVQCFVNPCDTARCTAFPKAQCHANYCGGCYAEFYHNNERVNCTGKAPKPGVCPIAPPGVVTTCDVNCQHDSECPRNEKCCNWACTVGCRTPDPVCPPGVPIAMCETDPCGTDDSACPAYPNAECRTNYCGGCNADYYYNDVKVNCTDCPSGFPRVQCILNPCNYSKCPAFPTAQCRSNYCGQCSANFYHNNSRVNCTAAGNSSGAPVFRYPTYHFTIEAPVPQNMIVGKVDVLTSNQVTYSIVNSAVFRINSFTGSITLATLLAVSEYTFRVQAADVIGRITSVEVTVTVQPTRTVNKTIIAAVYTVHWIENSEAVINLYNLGISTLPAPGQPDVSFSLENTDDSGTFRLSNNGVITGTRTFDYESKREHHLSVMVKVPAQGFVRTMRIRLRIVVHNQNDNSPTFVGVVSPFPLSADLTTGDVLYKFYAEDADKNGTVASLLTGDSTMFGMDPMSKSLKLLTPMIAGKTYSVQVTVSDTGVPPMSTFVQLTFNAFDPSTAGRPVFPSRFVELKVREISEKNTLLKRITATGTRQIAYAEYPNSDKHNIFRVDNATGDIYTDRLLDRETLDEATFVMQATNSATGLASYVIIHLEIMDVNDNAVRWPFSRYQVEVDRQSKQGMVIFDQGATDADLYPQIQYTISGKYAYLFVVQASDTTIRLGNLPFPTNETVLYLQIEASDGTFTTVVKLAVIIH